jgi:hypothetical protein
MPKIPIWVYFVMENVSILYGHLDYFTGIWQILWPFGNFVVIWYILPSFGTLHQKNLATLVRFIILKEQYFVRPKELQKVDIKRFFVYNMYNIFCPCLRV